MNADELLRVLTFRAGFNTSVVVAGATLLGVAAGVVGAFAMLRRRALVADALGHAALPGVCGAFLVGAAAGVEGRSLPLLLLGAAASGAAGLAAIEWLARRPRIGTDTATAAVLGSSFGAGVLLLSIAQRSVGGGQSGLAHLVFGHTAGMRRSDAFLMASLAVAALLAALALGRAFTSVAFNERFARTTGLPVRALDATLAALVAVVTLAGMQAVGMLLVVALLVAPAAAARFWCERVRSLVLLSGAVGGVAGYVGAATSAVVPDAPAGAVIVLVAAVLFAASLAVAPRRGVVAGWLRRRALAERAREALREGDDPEATVAGG